MTDGDVSYNGDYYRQLLKDDAARKLRWRRAQRIADIIMVVLGAVALGLYLYYTLAEMDKETFAVWPSVMLLVFFGAAFVNLFMRFGYYGATTPGTQRRHIYVMGFHILAMCSSLLAWLHVHGTTVNQLFN